MREELSFREVIETLIKGKKTIALVTAAAILISGLYSFYVLKPIYEVESLIFMKFEPHEYSKKFRELYDHLSYRSNVDMDIFRSIISDQDLLKDVADDLNLDSKKYSPENISRAISFNKVDYTELYSLTMIHTDPAVASSIVNSISDKFLIEVEDWVVKLSFEDTSKKILDQKKKNDKSLQSAIKDMESFLEESPNILELEALIPRRLVTLANLRNRITDLEINMELKTSSTDKIEIQKEIIEIERAIANLQEEIKILELDRMEKTIVYADINERIEARRMVHKELSSKYETSLITEYAEAGIVEKAVTTRSTIPSKPTGPNIKLNIFLAAAAGFMGSIIFILFLDYWHKSTIKKEDSKIV